MSKPASDKGSPPRSSSGAYQTEESIEKNSTWFKGNVAHRADIANLDTYRELQIQVNDRLKPGSALLDIGNGGVFNYDISRVAEVTAPDLFLDEEEVSRLPPNVKYVKGSALDIPLPDASFDAVMISMLLHHLTGRDVASSWANVRTAIHEVARVLRPGGQFLLVESCVPSWFYYIERAVFRSACSVLGPRMSHPITLQYTASSIQSLLEEVFDAVRDDQVPKGRWVLQFGYKVPSCLTPAQVHILTSQSRPPASVASS